MDVVDFWKEQIAIWQENKECGFCWEFHAPIREDLINIAQFKDPCCVQVFLTNPKVSHLYDYSTQTERLTRKRYRYEFTVRFLLHAEFGTNMYNEIPDH